MMRGILEKSAPTFYCLRCHEPLPKADTARFISRSTEVRCQTCGLIMFGRELLSNVGRNEPRLNRSTSPASPPADPQAEVERSEHPGRLKVILRAGTAGSTPIGKVRALVAGALLSALFLMFGTAMVGALLQGNWLGTGILTLILAFLVMFLFVIARSRWGRDELTLDATGVSIERRLGRLRWHRQLPSANIELVRIARAGSQSPVTWRRRAVEIRGTRSRVRFGHQLGDAEQAWLRDELAAFIINHTRSPLRNYVRQS